MPQDPHAISAEDAIALTARWRQNMPPGGIKAGRFDRIAFDNLLVQPGCAGIRAYLGMKDTNEWTLVLVGTDANGNDMIAGSNAGIAAGSADDGGGTEEDPFVCPPYCDCDSPLNGPC